MEYDFNKVIRLLGRPVTYYPRIAEAFGDDIRTAVFLSNFYYWEGKQEDKEGWIYKSQKEIKQETGLGRYGQEQSRKALLEYGIMEEKLIGKPPTMHFRFNWEKLNEVLNKHFAGEKAHKVKIDPILFRMQTLFSQFFLSVVGIEYEWSKDPKGGKDWVNLRHFEKYFRQRVNKKRLEANIQDEATDEDIYNSWHMFLEMLPGRFRNKNLNPAYLYSNVNTIIQDLKNANRSSSNQSGHDFV